MVLQIIVTSLFSEYAKHSGVRQSPEHTLAMLTAVSGQASYALSLAIDEALLQTISAYADQFIAPSRQAATEAAAATAWHTAGTSLT